MYEGVCYAIMLGIVMIRYDDIGGQTRTELYNLTTMTWSRLQDMEIGRGQHACAHYNEGVVVAGGWRSLCNKRLFHDCKNPPMQYIVEFYQH